ncbi:uncharacterized protein CIMG_03278 [Coccidioides immitis RS]|uniref:Uncharacterized protein n=1 Tax=Coccidioides immitis (strain RS) TaxID=246410 RepID=J3KB04_COCIM|nr:uncharacterized protein CIMG_03278 [Coccidioides immitis RS]EAS32254.3 hypothetical protein CIMG_03278 [Coccidioides immitis RS]
MPQQPLDLDEKFFITIHNKWKNIFPGDCAVAKLSDKPFISISNLHGGLACLLISPTAVIICNFSPLTTQAAGRQVFAKLKKERDKYKQDLRCDGSCRSRLILLPDEKGEGALIVDARGIHQPGTIVLIDAEEVWNMTWVG